MWKGINGDVAWTLDGHYYLGCGSRGGREREIVYQRTYQDITGCLMSSGYEKLGTQEAMNDMFVVEEPRSWDGSDVAPTLTVNNAGGGGQRMPDKDNFNAVIQPNEMANTLQIYEKVMNIAASRNPILRVLRETYGAEAVVKWGASELAALQSAEILRTGMPGIGEESCPENRNKLDDAALPRQAAFTKWLLRDLREQQKCGCASQGRKSTEQQSEQLAEIMQKLPHESAQASKSLLDMWRQGEGIWALQQALYSLQEVWKSVVGKRERGGDAMTSAVVRRLTPLE